MALLSELGLFVVRFWENKFTNVPFLSWVLSLFPVKSDATTRIYLECVSLTTRDHPNHFVFLLFYMFGCSLFLLKILVWFAAILPSSTPINCIFFSPLERSGCNNFFPCGFRHKTEYQKNGAFYFIPFLPICTLQWSDKKQKNWGRETFAENNLVVFRKWRMVPIGIRTPLNGPPSFHSLAQFLSKKRRSGHPWRWWKRKPSKMPGMPPR